MTRISRLKETDDEVDADIERMVAVRRFRRSVNAFTYYDVDADVGRVTGVYTGDMQGLSKVEYNREYLRRYRAAKKVA